jgi:hypothetical protein
MEAATFGRWQQLFVEMEKYRTVMRFNHSAAMFFKKK